MVDYKEILRLSHNGHSLRQIAASTGHSYHTVGVLLKKIREKAGRLLVRFSQNVFMR